MEVWDESVGVVGFLWGFCCELQIVLFSLSPHMKEKKKDSWLFDAYVF